MQECLRIDILGISVTFQRFDNLELVRKIRAAGPSTQGHDAFTVHKSVRIISTVRRLPITPLSFPLKEETLAQTVLPS